MIASTAVASVCTVPASSDVAVRASHAATPVWPAGSARSRNAAATPTVSLGPRNTAGTGSSAIASRTEHSGSAHAVSTASSQPAAIAFVPLSVVVGCVCCAATEYTPEGELWTLSANAAELTSRWSRKSPISRSAVAISPCTVANTQIGGPEDGESAPQTSSVICVTRLVYRRLRPLTIANVGVVDARSRPASASPADA